MIVLFYDQRHVAQIDRRAKVIGRAIAYKRVVEIFQVQSRFGLKERVFLDLPEVHNSLGNELLLQLVVLLDQVAHIAVDVVVADIF